MNTTFRSRQASWPEHKPLRASCESRNRQGRAQEIKRGPANRLRA